MSDPPRRGPAVAALRKRLAIEGDLPDTFANGQSWDPVLAGAVKHFQQRNGLRPTGTVERRDAAGAERAGDRALPAARLERAAPRRTQFRASKTATSS